uniref:Uncharacterized protein n=1 Tax=Chenopodium quinoa TaxID=63459 RepID=A0A803N7R8_CHEQI
MMTPTTCFGGVHQVIGTNTRRGWWRRDFQGCNMLRYCNIGKGHIGVMLRKKLILKLQMVLMFVEITMMMKDLKDVGVSSSEHEVADSA